MATFNYVAMDSRGRETTGILELSSQSEALGRLKQIGLFPTRVEEAPARKPSPRGRRTRAGAQARGLHRSISIPGLSTRVRPKALTAFTRQLATLVDAGLPLLRGLRLLEAQQKHPALKEVIAEVGFSIEGGSTFAEALAQHPKVFNRLYVNMVKAGELGGVLEVVLQRLAEFIEKAQKIKGKVIAAMFYPVAVMVVAVAILAVLMIWVVPKFKDIFKDMLPGQALPGFTRFVLGISDAIANRFVITFCV